MSQLLRLLGALVCVVIVSACTSAASVESGSDGDLTEQEASEENETDAATEDGDRESETEIASEDEVEPEGEPDSEADDRDTELPRAERLPFPGTLVIPCADQETIKSANAVWGDGEGTFYLASQHVWIYDERTDTLSCLPEVFGQVWTLNGRKVDGAVEVWALGSTRLGRYRNAAWTFYPLPNGDTIKEWCTITHLFPAESVSVSYCGWAWLAFSGEYVVVSGERGHDTGDFDPYPPLPPTFLFIDQLHVPSGEWLAMDACSPANDFEGYTFGGHYYTMGHDVDAGKNLLFEIGPGQTSCQTAHEFEPGYTLLLYGADERGLYIGEHDFSDQKNSLAYGLKRAFVYNPETQASEELPLPSGWQTDLYATNGLSAEVRLFRGESIRSSSADESSCYDAHLLHYQNPDASYSAYEFGGLAYQTYGGGCLSLRGSDGVGPVKAPRLRHWADAKTAWLPDWLTRITYAR